MVPHVTDCIQNWVERVAAVPVDGSGVTPEVCIIEVSALVSDYVWGSYGYHLPASLQLGGTIGDIEGMAFVEAFRQFQLRVKRENFVNVHVSLVPEVCACCLFCLADWGLGNV